MWSITDIDKSSGQEGENDVAQATSEEREMVEGMGEKGGEKKRRGMNSYIALAKLFY